MGRVTKVQIVVKNALAMRKLGGNVAESSMPGAVIYLRGQLGVGKTTFVRGFLKKLGYKGIIKSPTFNLFEIYQIDNQIICHVDLYRLKHPEELVYIGIIDYFNKKNIWLIEWPENGQGFLPAQDLLCCFDFTNKGINRVVEISSNSLIGNNIVDEINKK